MDAEAFAASWLAAFNARDLDAILAHYADDVEHSSPAVVRVLGEPSGLVRGKAALRDYFAKAIAAAPADLHYERVRLHAGVEGVTLVYHRTGGKLVAETFWFDARGLVKRAFVAHAEEATPRIERNHHVLAVHDLEANARFLRDALGFDEVGRPAGWVFLARDHTMVMLGLCPDSPRADAIGDHAGVAYFVVDDVDAFHERAQRVGATITHPLADKPWGLREFGLRGPEGHRVQVGAPIRNR